MRWLFAFRYALALAGVAWAGEWHVETVDAEGWVGTNTSLALDSSDYPHISYCDIGSNNLKYAYWNGSAWHIETVDSECRDTSLALDSSDRPCIAYYDDTNDNLKYAHWSGGSWHIETVDSEGYVGMYASLALDSADRPCIAYNAYYPEQYYLTELIYARWTGDSWQMEAVESHYDGEAAGEYCSLALDESDNPHISYYYCTWPTRSEPAADGWDGDSRNGRNRPDPPFSRGWLKYARWDGDSWQIEIVDDEDYDVGQWTSLVLDSSGHPHISYYGYADSDLRYARWDGGSWQRDVVESVGEVGGYNSLALDSSDRPRISYYDDSHGDLKLAVQGDGGWWKAIVDSAGDVGMCTSLALDLNNSPRISYFDLTNGNLKYAWYESGPGVEGAEVYASVGDEGVLVGWAVTGDAPASLRVLRSTGKDKPVAISGVLPGTAVRWLDTDAYDASDKGLKPLAYWLEVVEEDGTVSRFGPSEAVTFPESAGGLTLSVYPSPAADAVTVAYTLPEAGRVTAALYDLAGRRVATVYDGEAAAGRHDVSCDVSALSPGVYLARLETDAGTLTRRVVVAR
jgi:hypothetical protein